MLRWLIVSLFFVSASAMAAPDISMTDLTGKQFKLSDYRGKWVVVNHWATWCPPCLEEIPELTLFHEGHKDKDAVVIGINMEEIAAAKLSRFVDEHFMTFPVIPNGFDVQAIGSIQGLPTTFIIDPTGKPVARRTGGVTAEEIEAFISKSSSQAAP